MVDRWLHAYSGTAHIASPSAHSSSPPISAAILPPPLPPSVPNLSADPGSPHASTVTASLGGEKRGDSKAADQVRAYRRHVEQMQESEKLLYAEIDELRAALSAEREVARATERVAEAECWRRLEVERGRAALAREVERLQEELADALEQADGGGEEGGDAGGRGREERLSEVERQAREEVAELEEQMEQVCASAAQREQQFRALLREMEEELGAAQAMAMVAMEREERANDALHTLRQVNDQLMQRLLQQGKVLRAHRPPADHGKQHTDGAEGEAADDDGGVTRGEHERVKDEGACAEGGGGKGLGTGGCGEDSSEGVKAAVDARQERCEERCEESAGREVTADVDVSPPRCAEEFAVPPLHPCASPQSSRGKAVGGGQGKTRASSCDTSSAGSSGSAGSMTGLCSGCRQKMIRARVGAAGRSSTPSSTSSGSRASTGESSPGRRQTEQEEEARRGWRERGSDAQPRGHERCVYETRMGDSSEEGDGVQQGGNSAVQSGSSSGRGEQGKEGEAAERGSEGAASADDAMEGGSGSCCSRQGESMDGMIASDSVDRDDDVASTGDSGGQETKEGAGGGGAAGQGAAHAAASGGCAGQGQGTLPQDKQQAARAAGAAALPAAGTGSHTATCGRV
ncbi:hypothetical protein CLOM_g7455 [Closterium sp. NIES-68]|nr:hypothetical protein CLOM_g7455 [Closterium sp. NIES-68]GJP81015.1 hypothetical protein CLOP_g11198 [Closterium sp. NIES-67]